MSLPVKTVTLEFGDREPWVHDFGGAWRSMFSAVGEATDSYRRHLPDAETVTVVCTDGRTWTFKPRDLLGA